MKIIIASTNQGKVDEILAILPNVTTNTSFEYESLTGNDIPEPDEPFPTFMQNACFKARYYSNRLNAAALSEDAGLCIDALNNFPGAYTKNLVMECGNLDNAYQKLQAMLQQKNNFTAHYVCAAALYLPDVAKFITYEGKLYGTLTFPPRGKEGFGFDPIFIPEGFDKTLAELGNKLKNQISHRADAMRGIAREMLSLNNKLI